MVKDRGRDIAGLVESKELRSNIDFMMKVNPWKKPLAVDVTRKINGYIL